MKTIIWEDAETIENPHNVDVRRLYNTEHAQIAHILLKPNEQLKKHITPVDAIFFVLKGVGIVEIGDEKQEVGEGTLIDSPAKIPHCWYNEGENLLRILVIKVPRPEKSTKIL
jgi:mannose-6-phosphate isomerase-like protein (cupin superfamily)